ncbi:mitochondrial 37S ribosomal protein uS2m Ecym_2438 [Eremothecium cymbalariae DBVPG|uniref:Ribosomal protein S2 n=1 Tax=Eremothecium cymbalariae (strain CBS 270.75 / DBVPG 7215 / KCTC 17166 / NRRL Y-17582) TaxID=931890 RepID=G8JPB0_ERECY|nr:Hypothetical protein Ecym_2438 [Eremothecium cymbalariae DBVPG\
MSLRFAARNVLRNARLSIRLQSTEVKATAEVSTDGEVISKERLRDFNIQAQQMLEEASRLPMEKALELKELMNSPSTKKEQQLDERLLEFFRKYAKYSKFLEPQNNSTKVLDFDIKFSPEQEFPYLVETSKDQAYSKQELFLRQLKHASHTGRLGADIKDVYFPHKDIFNPPSVEKLSIDKLSAAGVHLGQSTSLWRSSTQPYIYGTYKGIHIIDLNKTLSHLKRAAQVVEGVAERGGIILFLGTREGQKRVLQKAADRVNGYYVASRWIPGTLTNPIEISSVWDRHEVDYSGKPTGRELSLHESVSIVKPDLLIVLNPTENRNALREAMKARVPTIGIIDTDSEPSIVTYPIPGNDDSLRSVNLLISILAKAGEKGLANRRREVVEH